MSGKSEDRCHCTENRNRGRLDVLCEDNTS